MQQYRLMVLNILELLYIDDRLKLGQEAEGSDVVLRIADESRFKGSSFDKIIVSEDLIAKVRGLILDILGDEDTEDEKMNDEVLFIVSRDELMLFREIVNSEASYGGTRIGRELKLKIYRMLNIMDDEANAKEEQESSGQRECDVNADSILIQAGLTFKQLDPNTSMPSIENSQYSGVLTNPDKDPLLERAENKGYTKGLLSEKKLRYEQWSTRSPNWISELQIFTEINCKTGLCIAVRDTFTQAEIRKMGYVSITGTHTTAYKSKYWKNGKNHNVYYRCRCYIAPNDVKECKITDARGGRDYA